MVAYKDMISISYLMKSRVAFSYLKHEYSMTDRQIYTTHLVRFISYASHEEGVINKIHQGKRSSPRSSVIHAIVSCIDNVLVVF